MPSERELRNQFAGNDAIGTHLAADQWFAEMLRGRRFKTAIDLGCNTGCGYEIYGRPFADKCTFVDFADKCLDVVRKKFGETVNIICADLTVEWPDVSPAELVCLVQVIQHIPDISIAESVFEKACKLTTNTMLFSHYGAKKYTEGKFDGVLYYRRCPYEYLEGLIKKNNMKILHTKNILGDYNFVLEKE